MTVYQAFLNDKLVGQRTSPARYTHALVLSDFNSHVYRKRHEQAFRPDDTRYRISEARKTIALGAGNRHRYIWGSSAIISALDVAQAQTYLAGLDDDAIIARARERHSALAVVFIDNEHAKGDHVLSWHRSLENAAKAYVGALRRYPEYNVVVIVASVPLVKTKA